MKRIAATAGISETQAYNYFGSRERLFVELARREFSRMREARINAMGSTEDHYSRLKLTTKTYLREIGKRGGLLQTLLSSPEVRAMLRSEHRKQRTSDLHAHAEGLVAMYGISRAVALGCTVVLTRICLNAGKLIAEKKISLESAERLCLSMVLNGSRNIVSVPDHPVGRTQGIKAA
jgi:AcrR family transcriptional regulator